VPVLLRDDAQQTMDVAWASLARARNEPGSIDGRNPDLYLESLGVSDAEKIIAVDLARTKGEIDPVVSVLIAATNGVSYKHQIGVLSEYPIPVIRLPHTRNQMLLDIGCSWGRWSIAAARKGYRVVGIDPSLSAIMAAKRVAKQMNLSIDYICGDARHLPFCNNSFDAVFSYSVIQHFSKRDAGQALTEIGGVLKPLGICLVQMPNYLGVRSLLHLARRKFAEGIGFEVRYWSISELRRTFASRIGPPEFTVHCFFGLGLELTDAHLMSRYVRWAVYISENLRKLSMKMPLLTRLADSVYVKAVKQVESQCNAF
jgi:2-polyprenyl-3-methyl-5-hydroxy-6-metoxy-1,4-benzoquinol methylase